MSFRAQVSELRRALSQQGTSPRLATYMKFSQNPLNLLALCTVWLVVVPPSDFGSGSTAVFALRLSLSFIYGLDLTIRTLLARAHLRYLVTNPLSIAAVFVPPVRVVFSLRLVKAVFHRGHLLMFLMTASVLVLNGAAVVYFYERHAAGANIHTFGESVWWAIVTVTTVGYGDFYPVTIPGRITAVVIMFIGVLTLALVTAHVATSFFAQGPLVPRPDGAKEDTVDDQVPSANQAAAAGTPGAPADEGVTLAQLHQRLARIESLLGQLTATSPPEAGGE